jgi:hypothetical protein
MIVVQLKGGLGNQLFQYAAGKALAIKHGAQLYLDVRQLSKVEKKNTPRNYELGIFSHSADIYISKKYPLDIISAYSPLAMKFFEGLNSFFEKGEGFNDDFLNKSDNTYLVGYWQSYKYFSGIEKQLIADFELKSPISSLSKDLLNQIRMTSNSVAFHVRRGDYVTNIAANKFHGLIPASYYRVALDRVASKNKDLTAFIFSDDPEWCRDNLLIPDVKKVFIDHNQGSESWQDLYLMGYCKHHILANSSFSWWGAWFGDQHWGKNRSVIYPMKWSTKGNNNLDRAPSHWISL